LGPDASVFKAEPLAIDRACREVDKYWAEEVNPDRRVIIYSDSQAVLKALVAPTIVSSTLNDCILSLSTLGRNELVTLRWVRGHSGVDGNDLADRLACAGAAQGGHPTRSFSHSHTFAGK
jgi:ribonuclease HI